MLRVNCESRVERSRGSGSQRRGENGEGKERGENMTGRERKKNNQKYPALVNIGSIYT